MKINYEKMGLEPLVIPMVNFFNNNGLKTCMSCQGHKDVNMSLFWIEFDKTVTEDDIANFMWEHRTRFDLTNVPEKYKHREGYDRWFISNGRIAERFLLGVEGQRNRRWVYVAASPEAAEDDLRTWLKAEDGDIFSGHCNEVKG